MKRRAVPPICGLNFDQPLLPICIETGNIIARAIPIFVRDPTNLLRQIIPSGCCQNVTHVLQDTFIASLPEGAIAIFALRDVKLSGDVEHLIKFIWRRFFGQGRCGFGLQSALLGCAAVGCEGRAR